jgi:hypothetical protein
MALSYLILYLSHTGGGHRRLRASRCPTPLLSSRLPLRWVLGVRPSPLFVSSTIQLPCIVRPPLLLHPPPPNRLALSTPPPIASSAAQSPCIICPPLPLHLCRPISLHHPPPTYLTHCPCLPIVNCRAHCSNHRHCSLNLIVVFLPRRVTPTHHCHCTIALYRVLCPPLLVVLSATQLPRIVSFVPLFL